MHRSFIVRTLASVMLTSAALGAQPTTRSAAAPPVKGLFEPVGYSEAIRFEDVAFVNVNVGWVVGDAGTILRTTDGGTTWEAQLGGDPQSEAERIRLVHFLDERRGWAIQGMKLLHTRDGDSWEEIGSAPYGVQHMVFTSPRIGIVAGSPQATHYNPSFMYRTTDGGRTWRQVWTCEAKMMMGGLPRNFTCEIGQIQFPTPQVGYAVAKDRCAGMGCEGPPLIAKTTDGGATWRLLTGPGVLEQDHVTSVYFLDASTGFARLASKKLHMTTDGGATWRGIVASPGEDIQFADPSVGWGIELDRTDLRLSYTTDGGRRWNSREMKLPATIRAFSMPRRDRAYIVGEGGMVYRYRVVAASHPVPQNGVTGPAMPGFESPVDEQIEQLEQVVQEMEAELATASTPAQQGKAASSSPDAVNTDSVAAADSAAAWNEPYGAPLPPPSEFTGSCCRKSFSRLELAFGLISQSLPDFIARYKNLNLLVAALRMGSELPNDYRALKAGLRSFRHAQDKESAQAALESVKEALGALKQTTSVAMQEELPPANADTDDASVSTGAAIMSPSAGGAANTKQQEATKNAAKDAVKDAAKDAAKKGLGGLLRGKKP